MTHHFGTRTLAAFGIVAVAALVVLLLGGGFQVALVALVGGVAAALMAHEPTAPPPPPAEPPRSAATSALPDPGAVADAIAQPVLIVANGRVVHANAAARQLLGQHIVDQDVRIAIRHPGAAERLSRTDGEVPQGPVELVGLGTVDQRWEMRVAQASGGQRIVHLVDQTGNYAAERMRIDFVANASHELRTPLASILGFIETLDDEKVGADGQVRARFLKIMFDEARRMQRLIEDLISLSRIEGDKYRSPDQSVDLGALIAEVCAELRDAGADQGHAFAVTVDDGVPAIAGDRAQISQILYNLIGNAVKYGRDGTPVTVRAVQDIAGMIRLSVTDEGDGIAPEHLPRLTERFYRVDAGRSRAAGGTGLGLSIVKHIVERHRGRLDIDSVVGSGTTVSILLPAYGSVIKR